MHRQCMEVKGGNMAEKYDIIAATGCPTGIAHTFMAKEALEKAAAERGLTSRSRPMARSVSRTR